MLQGSNHLKRSRLRPTWLPNKVDIQCELTWDSLERSRRCVWRSPSWCQHPAEVKRPVTSNFRISTKLTDWHRGFPHSPGQETWLDRNSWSSQVSCLLHWAQHQPRDAGTQPFVAKKTWVNLALYKKNSETHPISTNRSMFSPQPVLQKASQTLCGYIPSPDLCRNSDLCRTAWSCCEQHRERRVRWFWQPAFRRTASQKFFNNNPCQSVTRLRRKQTQLEN